MTTTRIKNATSLDQLLTEIRAVNALPEDERPADLDRLMTRLPTFGGDVVDDTDRVYSWDETRLLVAVSHGDGLAIIPRHEHGRPGRRTGYRADVTRPHQVAIRLSEDERGWLVARATERGVGASEALRELIEDARSREG